MWKTLGIRAAAWAATVRPRLEARLGQRGGINVPWLMWTGIGVLVVTGFYTWWKASGSPSLNGALQNFTSNL